jgi:predicted deacetylase
MAAKYIYRLDDITSTMDWHKFWRYMELFRRYKIVPLLGIVPDNRDLKLMAQNENPDFWEVMRKLHSEGAAEFAQHGYQHVYVTGNGGLLGKKYGYCEKSEFAGLSYDEQLAKICAGQEILVREKIFTDVWMAPSHSYDENTLKALADLGFKSVTDGIALYPYKYKGLIFVPQQFWAPKKFPFGVITICIHIDTVEDSLYYSIEDHLSSKSKSEAFSSAKGSRITRFTSTMNILFKILFLLRLYINNCRLFLAVKRLLKPGVKRVASVLRQILKCKLYLRHGGKYESKKNEKQ